MDSFERYKLAIETKRKSRNGGDKPKRSSDSPLILKDKTYVRENNPRRLNNPQVLSDKTNFLEKQENKRIKTYEKKPGNIPILQVGSQLLKVQKKTNSVFNSSKENSLFEKLSGIVKVNPGSVNKSLPKNNNKFSKFTKEFEAPLVDNIASNRAISGPIEFINWFKNNKFDYILQDKNYEVPQQLNEDNPQVPATQKVSKQSSSDILTQLKREVYLRPEFRTDKSLPSHTILYVKKIGRFMYFAHVKNILNKEVEKILLIATDLRFNLEKDALLVLSNKCSYSKRFNDKVLRVYLRWHVYRDEILDLKLFKN